MKNTKSFVKPETGRARKADLDRLPVDHGLSCKPKVGKRFGGFGPLEKMDEDEHPLNEDYQPLATDEQLEALDRFYTEELPKIQAFGSGAYPKPSDIEKAGGRFFNGLGTFTGFDKQAPWIQTHSGRRFCPTNPNPDSIVLQDIAHALSMICRFSGHSSSFYSVAQHSVLVSYVCDISDRLFGLLHDGSEAYAGDFSSPLKHSGLFNGYIEMESKIQQAICKRFSLPMQEPWSVKRADKVLLATERRDLMSPRRSDWESPYEPLPFKIEPWSQQEAKDRFIKRFFELTGDETGYPHYLQYKDQY
jgi:5'-deoxynucleotidase YfbR-like HD superfamily hydrolase